MSENFEFLEARDKWLALLGRHAEGYVYSDPDSCLFKLRLMVETVAKQLASDHAPDALEEDLGTMLARLERVGAVRRNRADTMHAIRRDGNAAVHGRRMPIPTAMRRLRDAHGILKWYAQELGGGRRVRTGPFEPPPKPTAMTSGAKRALDEAEKLEDLIEQRRAKTRLALTLFADEDEAKSEGERFRSEIEALSEVSAAAGEPEVDAESVMLIMAMELEVLLTHPKLGLSGKAAKAEACRQMERAKAELDAEERRFAAERDLLVEEAIRGMGG